MTDPRPPAGTDLATIKDTLARAEAIPGCADNSCVWRPSSGMGTNGGCRCSDGRQGPRIIRWAGWMRRELPALLEEVERLRLDLAELRLTLAAEQGRQEGIARAAFVAGSAMAHDDTVEGRYDCDPGERWDGDPSILDDVLDEASLRAAMQAAEAAAGR